MAPRISLTVREATGEKGSLETWGKALAEPRSALEQIGKRLERFIGERFETRTGPDGKPWAPLSPTTLALHGDDTDELAERRFHVVDMGKKRVRVGLRSAIAAARQYGAPRNRMFGGPPAPIPARPMLPMSGRRIALPPALHREIMRILRDSLEASARAGSTGPSAPTGRRMPP